MERPTIELAGCLHVDPDMGTCHRRADQTTPLWIWIDVDAQTPLRIWADDEPWPLLERVTVDGGQRLRLSLPATVARLRIEAQAPRWREPFELLLVAEHEPGTVATARQLPESAAVESLVAALDGRQGAERLAILHALHKQAGNEARLAHAEAAAELAEALGRPREFVESATTALYLHAIDRNDLVAARRWIDRLAQAQEDPTARVLIHYYRGVLATRTGDLGSAIQAFDDAGRLAERLGMTAHWLGARQMHATLLAEIGRGREALKSARQALAGARDPALPCSERQHALGNVAWAQLMLAQAGLDHDPPRPLMREQLALLEPGAECPDPADEAWVRINLALAALVDAEPEEAWAWLEQGQLQPVPSWLRGWFSEIRAQIGLETGRMELLPPLVRTERSDAELSLRWAAAIRTARTFERFGLVDAAVDAYLDAERILDQESSTLGVDVGGQELFLAGRQASAQGLVTLLVEQGRRAEALCRARLAHGRELRSIDQTARLAGLSPHHRQRRRALLEQFVTLRDQLEDERRGDWALSAPKRERRVERRRLRMREAAALLDEAVRLLGAEPTAHDCAALTPPAPGELLLLPFDGSSQSWLLLADTEGVVVEPFSSGGLADALARQTSRVTRAERLRVLPSAHSSLHALPFEQGVLLDVAPVVYSLDLPARPPKAGAEPVAVVVADPSENLSEARAEAAVVARRLSTQGWAVGHYEGRTATRARVTAAMTDAALFHYAGHGIHRGPSGWDGALLLGDGDSLGVIDILALPRVPAEVVLCGCETASVSARTRAGGMNLSRAFVLSGARWVIAAEGVVDDALAREVGQALYAELPAGRASIDGASALRRILLPLAGQDPTGGWARFHVVVP
ncbi:MAG: CHAT domain-containing protein [Myxococcota bacterium]